jgi:hypothetical protein
MAKENNIVVDLLAASADTLHKMQASMQNQRPLVWITT